MSLTESSIPTANDRLGRLWRLTLKELREILRDRRTIFTLVLMPLLMYPLLSVAFQQFFMSQLGRVQTPRYTIGFRDTDEAQFFVGVLAEGGLEVVDVGHAPSAASLSREPHVVVEGGVRPELKRGLSEFDIHVGLQLVRKERPPPLDPRADMAVDVELLYRDDSLESREAASLIEKHLRAANEKLLEERLTTLGVTQRVVPIRATRSSAGEDADAEATGGTLSITAVIPFILILMTVTGAVYPAIDLTAGERERRGTLEILVAAPIPRVGVLFAKYVAVLTVALLTAACNLLTMTITLSASGLGRRLFGDAGLSLGVMTAIFGLLLLFAAFFSAVLLVITSCARSFKEAQAYLIPLMLVALAPGVLSLMPGLKLSGLLLVTPLANIVLLGRDLFAMKATAGAALTVVGSTLLYAGAAIGLAARIFGAESVLYSSQPGWSELLRRPSEARPAPTLTAAAVCLALSFPLYFLLLNLSGHVSGVSSQLMAGIVVTVVVFGLMPLAVCWMRRVPIGPVFRVPPQPVMVTVGVLLAAASLWMFDHEAVVGMKQWQRYELDPRIVEHLRTFAQALRNLPLPTVLLALAIVPAVFEELFFRGFLFGALQAAGNARIAIVASAIVFGLFHWISPNPFAAERVLSSTLTGCALGWVRWRTGSLLPGMLLHIGHNGLLALLLYFEPQLAAHGIGVTESSHLPGLWLAVGAIALVAGGLLVYLASRGVDAERVA